jgi:geranylgeranyl diphosphate synthase type II
MDIDQALIFALKRYLPAGRVPSNLQQSIEYSLLAPGKRIRPRLALDCGAMLGLSREACMPVALALEMTHCFTLIHDDLPSMDNDDFRRGKPSNHKVYGEAVALLAGDGLMTMALEVLAEAGSQVEGTCFVAGLRRFLAAVGPRGVIGGQAAELQLGESSTLADLRRMHEGKTGALFSAALLVPKDFAGVSDEAAEGQVIVDFARELGLAFQTADDLEDADGKDYPPASVLHYLSAEEAARVAAEGLKRAQKALSAEWGAGAAPLIAISDEVLRSLS